VELYVRASSHPDGAADDAVGLGRGVVGDLGEVPLWNLVQLVAASGRGYVVHVWDEPRTGRLYFDRGDLIHASVGSLRGTMAFEEMMRWGRGQFCLSVAVEIPHRNVYADLEELAPQTPGAV